MVMAMWYQECSTVRLRLLSLQLVLPGASKRHIAYASVTISLLQEYKRQVLPCLLLIIVNLQSSQGRPGEVHAPEFLDVAQEARACSFHVFLFQQD